MSPGIIAYLGVLVSRVLSSISVFKLEMNETTDFNWKI